MDCYTDPLGWKDRLMECGSITNQPPKASNVARLCKDVRNLDNLSSSILQLGKGRILKFVGMSVVSLVWMRGKANDDR